MTAREGSRGLDAEALVGNLEQQQARYARLTALAQRQLDGLVGGQSEDLGVLLAAQSSVIGEVQDLERERLALLSPLAEAWGQPAEEITMTALEPHLPHGARVRLSAVQTEFADTLTSLAALNERNDRLLRRSARILSRWRTLITASLSPAPTYSASGDPSRPSTPWALDQAA